VRLVGGGGGCSQGQPSLNVKTIFTFANACFLENAEHAEAAAFKPFSHLRTLASLKMQSTLKPPLLHYQQSAVSKLPVVSDYVINRYVCVYALCMCVCVYVRACVRVFNHVS